MRPRTKGQVRHELSLMRIFYGSLLARPREPMETWHKKVDSLEAHIKKLEEELSTYERRLQP